MREIFSKYFQQALLASAVVVAVKGIQADSTPLKMLDIVDSEPFDSIAVSPSNSEELSLFDSSFSESDKDWEASIQFYGLLESLEPEYENEEAIYSDPLYYRETNEEINDAQKFDDAMSLERLGITSPFTILQESLIAKQIGDFFEKLKVFKSAVFWTPSLLTTELPMMENEFSTVASALYDMESRGFDLPTEVAEQFDGCFIVFAMLDLNRGMRQLGCGDQLGFAPNMPKTILKDLVEKMELFVVALSGCYDEKDQPNTSADNFAAVVANLTIGFEALQEQFRGFISQGTILSEIFLAELKAIETEIEILNSSVQTNQTLSTTPNAAVVGFTQCPEPENKEAKQNAMELRELETRIRNAHSLGYHNHDFFNFEIFHQWRDGVNTVCEEAISQLTRNNYPHSCEKQSVLELLDELSTEITGKVNSVLLLATELSTNEHAPDDLALSLFAAFHEILRNDIRQVDLLLNLSLRNLNKIKTSVSKLGFEDARIQTQVQKELLEDTTRHIRDLQWAHFADAEGTKIMEMNAHILLGNLERLLLKIELEKK